MQDDGKPTLSPATASNWRELATQASTEADPTKLTDLVKQLCDRLDHLEQQKKKPPQSDDSAVNHSKLLFEGE